MDAASSAITGSLKVGLQIVSNYRRPVLEIYYQVRNRFGPKVEYHVPKGINGTETEPYKTRHQDIFIQFTLVNIGGVRAESIELNVTGELKRNSPRESFGDIFDTVISQMAPGQTHHLFSFDDHDLNNYPEGGGSPLGIKNETFTITMAYNSPKGVLNWFLSLPARLRGKKQHSNTFTFSPKMVVGDLPPAEYA